MHIHRKFRRLYLWEFCLFDLNIFFVVIECTCSNEKDISVLEPLRIISESVEFNCVNGHIRKKFQFVGTWGMGVDLLLTSFCKSDTPNSAKI